MELIKIIIVSELIYLLTFICFGFFVKIIFFFLKLCRPLYLFPFANSKCFREVTFLKFWLVDVKIESNNERSREII